MSDGFAACHPANDAGSVDGVEIVVVRHEGRAQLEARCGMHTILSFLAGEIGRACEDKAFLDPDDVQGPEEGGGDRGCGRGRQELSVAQVLLREEYVSDEPDVRRKQMDDEPERVGDPWNRL